MNTHYLFHHLDAPLRLLYWTLDEAMVLIMPAFLGLGFERPLLGLFLSGLGFWGLRQLKKRCGLSVLTHVLYWLLPSHKRFPHLPPSSIREVVG